MRRRNRSWFPLTVGDCYRSALCRPLPFQSDETHFELRHLAFDLAQPLGGGSVDVAAIGFQFAEADAGRVVVIAESTQQARFSIVRAFVDVLFHSGKQISDAF